MPQKSKQLNVLGFMNQANELHTFEKEGTIKSDFVVESINELIKKKQNDNPNKPLVLVLDNAKIHHSEIFKTQIELWQEKNLFIFFYLHTVHILIRLKHCGLKQTGSPVRYEWLKPKDYISYTKQKMLSLIFLTILDKNIQ